MRLSRLFAGRLPGLPATPPLATPPPTSPPAATMPQPQMPPRRLEFVGKLNPLAWLDRYIYVDRLYLRPAHVFPRLQWWQWIWYIAVVVAAVIIEPIFDAWQHRLLAPVPILHYVPFIVTWPVLGLFYGLGARFLLPARQARDAAPGENWLIGGIWVGMALLGLIVDLDWSK